MQRLLLSRTCLAVLAGVVLLAANPVLPCGHAGEKSSMKAFWLTDIPADYAVVERLFLSYRDAGADTVIVGTLTSSGPLTIKTLSHIIFLAHKSRLKIFVSVATRRDQELLRSHPDWGDRIFDLRSGSLRTDETVNLFRPEVLEILVKTFRDVSSYTVDGIFLDEDFTYEDTDGMSREVFAAYKKKFGKDPDPKKLFTKVERTGDAYRVVSYGDEFENFMRLKQERLGTVFKSLKDASRSVNKEVMFGIPLRFSGYENILVTLSDYTRTVRAFKRAGPDYYWTRITQRGKEGLTYKQGMESIARASKIIETAVEDKEKAVIVLSMMNETGRMLPTTEIEEMTNMARQGGIRTVIYRVKKDLPIPVPVTRKMFNPKID